MSDDLFPDKEKKEYKYKEEDKSLIKKLKERAQELTDKGGKEKDTSDQSEDSSHSQLRIGNDDEDKDDNWKDNLDRFTVIVVGIEVFLVIYFILALLGLVPFF